jgi:multimeric flavodoxin WrbA
MTEERKAISKDTNIPEGTYAITENEHEYHQGIWRKPKRVLAIHASPKKNGLTSLFLSNLLEGMKETGAEVDTIYLSDQDIEYCEGCFTCWTGKDGKCVNDDDMTEILPTIPTYDLLILATPVYIDGMTGQLKTFLDRTIPLHHPHIFMKDGHCRHPSRYPRMPSIVLLSVCGYYEVDNFDPLIDHVEAITRNLHSRLVGSILRPNLAVGDNNAYVPIFSAVKEAGIQIIEKGSISEELQQKISNPVVSGEEFIENMDGWYKR